MSLNMYSQLLLFFFSYRYFDLDNFDGVDIGGKKFDMIVREMLN